MTRSLFARATRSWRALTFGAAFALASAAAGAQSAPHVAGSDNEPVKPQRTFSLFGIADQAFTGMRQGGRTSWKVTNSGPSDDDPSGPADLSGRVIGTVSSPNSYCCGYFELQLWATAGRGDWARARDNIPSLENVLGGGWNARTQLTRWVTDRRQLAWTGRDGAIGSLFSGTTSTAGDGSCKDNSTRANAIINAGTQLLAGSDCPPTWTNPSRFDGERVVADTTWLNEFRAKGTAFTFDDWKFDATRRDESRLYGAFQTFGATNDFGREQRILSGNVIPGGTGKSQVEGYPLGIEWEWNAWSYAVPSLGDAVFYKANIINKSADVYGIGINYDSLFLGFMVRPFHTTNTQQPAVYADLQRGTVFSAQTNVNTQNCYGNKTKGTGIRSCLGNTQANRGFRGGAGALVFLKSPIGDQRNKLFTRVGTPYNLPSHPQKGDTLTYNIMTACGFTCATQQITPGRVRAAHGGIIGDVANALAGRGVTSSELSELQYFDLVHNPDWPTRFNPATGTAGGYAKYIPPGGWDYNHDGILDTMTVTTCWNSATTTNWTGIPTNSCAPAWSDTLAGGMPNGVHNNYFAGVGPVKLKAGDTTSFIVAFVSTPDSISMERQVNDIIQLYNDFWLSPQPPVPVQIVSASVVGGSRQFDTSIRLFLDQTPNSQVDQFVLEQARKLKTSTDRADIVVRTLNRTLVSDIKARALPAGTIVTDTVAKDTTIAKAGFCTTPANTTTGAAGNCEILTSTALGVVDSLFVFKSCDGGTTFTATGGNACVPAPARDVTTGAPSGYNWQSYSRLAKVNGQWPSQYTDGNVTGGVTYTYVFVSQSYPVSFQVVDIVNGRPGVREYIVRPKTQNGLSANTANRNVATVYVPASTQAGGAVAASQFVNFSTAGFVANDTAAALNVASFRLSKPIRGGNPIPGRVIFSDSAIVTEWDRDTTAAGIDSTVVQLFELVADSMSGSTVVRRRAGRAERFVVPGSAGVVDLIGRRVGPASDTAATAVRSVQVVTVGSQTHRVTTTNYRFKAFLRPQVTFILNGLPIYVTDSIPGGADLTPAQTVARPDFAGALLALNTPSLSTSLPNSTMWRAPGIPLLRTNAWPTMSWQSATSRDSLSFGRYRIDFVDTEFGPGAPFKFDTRNPGALKDAYTASVTARAAAQHTVTSAAAATALATALGRAITTDSLADLTLPFTISNLRFGNRSVQLAALKNSLPTTALLGLAGDTVRVNVPSGHWIPGMDLYFLESLPTYRYDTLSAPGVTPVLRRIHRDANGNPDTTVVTRVTWGPARLGCGTPTTCNPIEGFASSGYTLARAGMQYELQWFAPLRGLQTVEFNLLPERAGQQVTAVPTAELKNVRAVPNPYIMYSEYEQTPNTKRMMFVGLPPKGTLRIYTASGQFVQQITWVESDLERNCRATTTTTECIATGDLTWNLRSHENKEIGPGFYMFVVSTDVGGKKDRIGKFVVIH